MAPAEPLAPAAMGDPAAFGPRDPGRVRPRAGHNPRPPWEYLQRRGTLEGSGVPPPRAGARPNPGLDVVWLLGWHPYRVGKEAAAVSRRGVGYVGVAGRPQGSPSQARLHISGSPARRPGRPAIAQLVEQLGVAASDYATSPLPSTQLARQYGVAVGVPATPVPRRVWRGIRKKPMPAVGIAHCGPFFATMLAFIPKKFR